MLRCFLEYALWEVHNVRVLKKSLKEVAEKASMDKEGRLWLEEEEVAVSYFRAGYGPEDYPSEVEWSARLLLERSAAVKCPSVDYQLVGAKKVQQALARPGAVERFLGPDSAKLRGCFAGLWGLGPGEDDQAIVKLACEKPEGFVLKPQREGGGHNFYGKDVAVKLKELSPQERSAYILMQRILPGLQESVMTRQGQLKVMECLSEFGFYSVYLGDGRYYVHELVEFEARCSFLSKKSWAPHPPRVARHLNPCNFVQRRFFVAEELRILWSPPLFTRLWCVFELAAFCAANASGQIKLMPQYFVAIAVAGWVSTFLLALVFWGMQRIEFGWVHLLCMCAAGFAATHLGRRVSLQKQSLIEQLESFTLDGAACRLESDRDFIYEAVTQLYGGLGQFTDFVRGPLRRQLLQCCSQIPADLLLFLVLPLVAYKAELLLAMWKGGVPGNILIAYCCSSVLGLSLLWTAFVSSLGLYLVDLFARPTRSGVLWDLFQSLFVTALTVTPYFAGYVLDERAREGNVVLIAAWAALLCLSVAWFCWAASAGLLIAPFVGCPFEWKMPRRTKSKPTET
ncbi:unnamed protein product [Effrenium voratum]|nr:unnamed protein product [Effrenium voratum]